MESLSLPTQHTPSTAGDLVDIMSPPSSSSPVAEPQHYLKLEDLHSSTSNDDSSAFQTSPPPVIVHSKQAKKRKSWGQELPEPKTSLPPRKRAKTEDEKEQRRIERIKRNRAAAHNSRERKRQETETLAVALARANAELDAYRRLHGPLPASVVLPEVTLSLDSPDTPAPSLIESTGSIDALPSPRSPPEHTFHVDVPIKQEMTDSVLPAALLSNLQQSLESRSVQPSRLDPTQHSAVSVDSSEEQHPHLTFQPTSCLVDESFPLHDDASTSDLLQDHLTGHLEPFAFTDGAMDASFNPPLDFSFDDFIHDSATVAVDGHGAA